MMLPNRFLSRPASFNGIILLVCLFSACADQRQAAIDPAYQADIEKWRTDRVAGLTAPDGWLALAGLFWLEEGENTFGSAAANDLVFPANAPAKMGIFHLHGDSSWLEIEPGVSVSSPEGLVKRLVLTGREEPVVLEYESQRWLLIERGGRFGIRLWDTASENLRSFTHIEYYPLDPAWRVSAKLIAGPEKDTLLLRNVLDMEIPTPTEGKLHFEWEGQALQLTVLDGGPTEYFIMFADQTTGEETYPGGRYLYAPRADSTGMTTLDFNRAYNPPCAFTRFATCLLPPAENRLEVAIRAGEKNYGAH